MATKVKKPEPKARNVVKVGVKPGGDFDAAVARHLLNPVTQSAAFIQEFEGEVHEVNAVIDELTEQANAIHAGDMRRVEAMLIAQAHSLDEMFANMGRRGYRNIKDGYLEAGEKYLRLGLKAQSQCRTTLEALAEIKNPRAVAFVKQANIANGPQQVNNGNVVNGSNETNTRTGAHWNNPIQSNELLEVQHGNYLEPGATGATVSTDSGMATVGRINRATD